VVRAVGQAGIVRIATLAVLVAVLLSGCTSSGTSSPPPPSSTSRSAPRTTPLAPPPAASPPAHIVVVVEENHSFGDIIGNADAPYINQLARSGRSLTQMYAITHPSEPNYLALFSGSTQGVTDDSCPHTFGGSNLAHELLAHGRTFVAYSEGLPAPGSGVCTEGSYARKHAPWTNFSNLPATQVGRPFSDFPSDYAKLPTVSFVIPNLDDDMHDGTIAQADAWLKAHLSSYTAWARSHHSQLIVTWDEDDGSASNHVPTIITGAGVRPGASAAHETLYSLLRLVEQDYGLPLLGGAARAPTIALR
jgi:phosphatidylinositol-3-phosphatase